jgi:hypothetical protein
MEEVGFGQAQLKHQNGVWTSVNLPLLMLKSILHSTYKAWLTLGVYNQDAEQFNLLSQYASVISEN